MPAYKSIPYEEISSSSLGKCIDLASAALGSTIVAVTDEFFAPATNMINPAPPLHCPGRFVEETGAWMDGWESKRHNPTYDWAIIRLGFSGFFCGFDIDTHYFTGNQAPAASVEAAYVPEGDVQAPEVQWTEILPRVNLPPNRHNVFVLEKETSVYTHLRLNNIPDGGIARFRAYGNVASSWPNDISTVVDLAFVGNGGRSVQVSDEHYTPGSNLLLPGRGVNMGDGWETKRSRVAGHTDYVVIRLGDKGHLIKAAIDTSHYKGNYPDKILLEATSSDKEVPEAQSEWTTLIEKSSVGPHDIFYFDLPHTDKAFTHAKITIIPDGGLKRVHLYGVRSGGTLPSLPMSIPTKVENGIVIS
ncbi:allantoicase [Spinellus fusiger]|nr:allantoicase [Spinellus fusiger]